MGSTNELTYAGGRIFYLFLSDEPRAAPWEVH